MKATAALALMMGTLAVQAVDRYVSLEGGHVAPFSSWVDAATNIQDAIDASVAGDTVWVTNGLYNIGGKVMAGDLTNRVTLDKAITLQSINGPQFTIIEGEGSGTNAVRCAWMTNGATLSGFILQHGGTRTEGDAITLRNGGGVWCESTSCLITNCLIRWNNILGTGGGIFRGTISGSTLWGNTANDGGGAAEAALDRCILIGNQAFITRGGGAYKSSLTNCAVLENLARLGGGAYDCSLYNCTVTRNQSFGGAGGTFLTFFNNVRNSIVYGNAGGSSSQSADYNYPVPNPMVFEYTCTSPMPSQGIGNISADPQLLSDGMHVAENSPCHGAGSTNYASGSDIDGQPWANPSAIGCDEWYPEPVAVGVFQLGHDGGMGEVSLSSFAVGAEPLAYGWLKDGTPLSNGDTYSNTDTLSLRVGVRDPSVAGVYSLVVSNAYGSVTGQVSQLKLHYVNAGNLNSVAPYGDWGTAAISIQEAVDAAIDGEVVVVTNGLYNTGGRTDFGLLTNRLVVNKFLVLTSANGPADTIIQGAWDPSTTNGPLAVRCVRLGGNSTLKGFTLRGGATMDEGSQNDVRGGGVLSGYVVNCRIVDCRAGDQGGGVASAQCSNSEIIDNIANVGGGFSGGWISNCIVTGNSAIDSGGGVVSANCRNSIVFGNSAPTSPNFSGGFMFNSCSTPIPPGVGNIDADPQLMDGSHIAINSPCRGMGNPMYSSGVDLDGQAWLNPPSMGCDEVYEADYVGPLSVSMPVTEATVVQGVPLTVMGLVEGRASSVSWDFADGMVGTNVSYVTSHTWTNLGVYKVTLTAYNLDNPDGVSAVMNVEVLPLEEPGLTVTGYASNRFGMKFISQPGVGYVVERTTNLVPPIVWSAVTTRTGSGGVEQVIDSKATNDMRFYRIRVP